MVFFFSFNFPSYQCKRRALYKWWKDKRGLIVLGLGYLQKFKVKISPNDELHSSSSRSLLHSLSLSLAMDALVAQLQMQYRNYTVSLYQQVCFHHFPLKPPISFEQNWIYIYIDHSIESLNLWWFCVFLGIRILKVVFKAS